MTGAVAHFTNRTIGEEMSRPRPRFLAIPFVFLALCGCTTYRIIRYRTPGPTIHHAYASRTVRSAAMLNSGAAIGERSIAERSPWRSVAGRWAVSGVAIDRTSGMIVPRHSLSLRAPAGDLC